MVNDQTIDQGPGIEVADAVYSLKTKPHKGSPQNPFSWDEICEKFRRYTREIIGVDQAEAIIGGIACLEQSADVAEIARLVALQGSFGNG